MGSPASAASAFAAAVLPHSRNRQVSIRERGQVEFVLAVADLVGATKTPPTR